jgi:hypothetical protein
MSEFNSVHLIVIPLALQIFFANNILLLQKDHGNPSHRVALVEKRSKTISVRVLYMGVMLIRQKMVAGL